MPASWPDLPEDLRDNVATSLGVVFAKDINTENNTYTVTEILDNTVAASDGWVTSTADLSAYTGESIAMIGLYFKALLRTTRCTSASWKHTSGQNLTPDAPTGPPLTRAQDTNEMVVSWDLGEYDSVKQYNVYAVINGVEQAWAVSRRDLLHQGRSRRAG